MEKHRPCARRKKKLRSLPESLANGKHASTRVHRKPPQRDLKSLKTASTRENPENYARVRSVSSPDLRAHTFFFSTKSALINVGERAEKNFTPRKPRARVQTRRARSRENRAISVFDANRTGKKREERRESIRSSRRTIFVYLRFFFCFLFLACEKCEEGEFLRSEREREQREMKNRKIRCCDAKKKFEKLCLLSTFSRERERERERERLHIFKEETVLFCCRLMR